MQDSKLIRREKAFVERFLEGDVCLRRGHISRNCRSQGQCRRCGGRHHAAICNQVASVDLQPDSQPPPPKPITQENRTFHGEGCSLNPTAMPFTSTPTTCCYVNIHKTVLLQTVWVTVFNLTDPTNQREITLILDSGSQKSMQPSQSVIS